MPPSRALGFTRWWRVGPAGFRRRLWARTRFLPLPFSPLHFPRFVPQMIPLCAPLSGGAFPCLKIGATVPDPHRGPLQALAGGMFGQLRVDIRRST